MSNGPKKRVAETVIAQPTMPPPGGQSRGAGAGFKLVMIAGPHIGQEIPLEGSPVDVGREDCTVTIESDLLSRKHYAIEPAGATYRVRDLGSTNGTFVNNQRIDTHPLAPGDLVKAGGVVFKFMEAGAVEARYHEEMAKRVSTDALTGARNKRYFDEEFGKAVYQAAVKKQPLCLVVLDIDFFKKVNDSYGHAAGDHVLIEVCKLIDSLMRTRDIFARVGGEEFAIILPDTASAVARGAAEIIRGTVEMSEIAFDGTAIPITLSLGVAELDLANMETADVFYQRADARLYAAKDGGRNQVK